MAYQVVESVMRYSRTKDTARLILMVIATHADADSHQATVGHETIAREANCSERTVKRTLKEIEASAELTIQRGNGAGHLTVYEVNLPRWSNGEKGAQRVSGMTPLQPQKRVTEKGDNADTVLKKDDTSDTFVGEKRVTENAKRVTDQVKKGDKSGNAYKEEPLGTIEPEGNARARAEVPPSWSEEQLEAMFRAVVEVTNVQATSWRQEHRLRSAAIELCQVTTPEQLRHLHRNRGRPYRLTCLLDDAQADLAANAQGGTNGHRTFKTAAERSTERLANRDYDAIARLAAGDLRSD